jgi:hypothetical protein
VVIVIAKNIQISTVVMIEVGIDQKQRSLMKSNKNMVEIE